MIEQTEVRGEGNGIAQQCFWQLALRQTLVSNPFMPFQVKSIFGPKSMFPGRETLENVSRLFIIRPSNNGFFVAARYCLFLILIAAFKGFNMCYRFLKYRNVAIFLNSVGKTLSDFCFPCRCTKIVEVEIIFLPF